MDKKKLKHYRELLLEEQNGVKETLQKMEDHNGAGASMLNATGDLSAYDNHPADLGTEMFMTEMQANLQNHELFRLSEIERALNRIEAGSFGKCEL